MKILVLLVLAAVPAINALAGSDQPGIRFLLLNGAGIFGTVTSAGQVWMDRNLGAARVATSSTDSEAYGDLYQWGRLADGHQRRTSPTTSSLSNTDVPGHGSFILVESGFLHDWRDPQNDNLWQGVTGANNPCPSGFRLPTETEWKTEIATWGSVSAAGAFASTLKLVVAGNRTHFDGSLNDVGSNGHYWSSTVDGSAGCGFFFSSSSAGTGCTCRAFGKSVRCIKD